MVLISALGVSAPFAGLRPSGLSPPALSPVRERESEHKLKNTQGREGENGKTARGNTQITRGERSRGGEVSGGRGAAAWRVGTRDAEGCRSQREHVQQGSWGSAKARGAKRSVPNQLVVFGDMS